MWVQTITDSLSCLLAVILYSHFKKKLEKQFSQQQPENSTPHFCHNIITISREFSSGGRTIGKEVASKLGIPCYDSDLIEKIAQESGFAKEYVERYGEYAQADTLFENYEVCLDSGKIGINGCIAMISAMYKHKFAVETKNNAVTK